MEKHYKREGAMLNALRRTPHRVVTWFYDAQHRRYTIVFADKVQAMPPYEIINHGWGKAQYSQGCGVAHAPFDHVVTGTGYDAAEAYQDALDQIYWAGPAVPANIFPRRPRGLGITKRNHVPAHAAEECYWYVSIRYTL